MNILGIETSCDETAAAVVEDGTKILSNIVSSSQTLQQKYGGILPEQAAREQVKYIIPVIQEALMQAFPSKSTSEEFLRLRDAPAGASLRSGPPSQVKNSELDALKKIDAIAVTIGPGLIGSLLVGVETAKTLAYVMNKPIVPINHHLGHIYANWINPLASAKASAGKQPSFPAVCLIVSGGHTLLIYMQDHGKWKILGQTRDDAAGEAFDKTARLLGLTYPGGPAIEKTAISGDPKKYPFPRPMIDSDDYDFSFSGLKTAVLREVRHLEGDPKVFLTNEVVADLASSIQEAIVDVLIAKTIRAATEYNVKSIIVGGGVAANQRLKTKFEIRNSKFEIYIPPPSLCTDNAAVIASAAYFNNHPIPWQKVNADPSLAFPSAYE